MFKNLFIIGNGFDLNLNYNTRFKDFINFCIRFDKFIANISEFKSSLYIRLENTKLNSLNDFDKDLGVKRDYIYDLPKLVSNGKIVYNGNEYESKSIYLDFRERINNSYLIKYYKRIINDDIFNTWADVEMNLTDLCKAHLGNANKEGYYYYFTYIDIRCVCKKISTAEFVNLLFEDINKFKELFSIYINSFVQIAQSQCSMDQFHKYKSSFENESTCILNFNYTNFSRLISNCAHFSVHGDVENKDIVLGINPLDKDLGNEFNILKKKCLVDLKQLSGFDNQKGRIIVLGHSLGIVDEYILKQIFDKFYGEIILTYYDSVNKDEKLKNRLSRITSNKNIKSYNIISEWAGLIKYVGGNIPWIK